jgi:hypothetical protein
MVLYPSFINAQNGMLENHIGEHVKVKTSKRNLQVEGVLFAVDRSNHSGYGNIIVLCDQRFSIIRGSFIQAITINGDEK